MALVQGVNSYVTEAEAEAYFEDRVDGADWLPLVSDAGPRALVTATRILEALQWRGNLSSSSQSLSFPRSGLYDSNRRAYLDSDTIPEFIKQAQMELAFYIVQNNQVITGEQVRETTTVGSLTVETVPLPKLPTVVRRLVRPYLSSAGSFIGRSA